MLFAAALTFVLGSAQGQNAYAEQVKSNPQLMGYWRLEPALADGGYEDLGPSHDTASVGDHWGPSEGALGAGGGAGLHCGLGDAGTMTIPNRAEMESASFSAEVWFRITDHGNTLADRSLFRQTGSHGRHIYLGLWATTVSALRSNFTPYDSTTATDFTEPKDDVSENEWHHVVVAVGATRLALYLDGTLHNLRGDAPQPALLTDSWALLCNNGVAYDFDELALYQGILSPADIQQHYLTALAMRDGGMGNGSEPVPVPRTNAFALGCSSSSGGLSLALPGLALGLVLRRRRRGS